MTQWQPIETAPKDGTRILIYDPKDDRKIHLAVWEDWGDSEDAPGAWCEPYEYYETFEPTHWQPLPQPPE